MNPGLLAKLLASPTAVVLALGVLGTLLTYTPYARWGRSMASFAVLLLAFMLFGPIGHLLAVPLETRFPPPKEAFRPDGIIVLGGAAGVNASGLPGHVTFNDSAERLTAPIELKRIFPDARLAFTSTRSETALVRDFWRRVGLDRGDVLYDETSQDTYANAVATRDLVAPKPGERWLLITSATHMPRAMGAFRHVGFPVIAYPVDLRTTGETGRWHWGPHPSKNLSLVEAAAHEWIGLLVYRLLGRTDSLFPTP